MLQILSNNEKAVIHKTGKRILSEVGIRVRNKTIYDLLLGGGGELRPCIYNSGFAHVFDMMTTLVLTGSPENALLQGAGAEMAQYHGLPSASWALSDSVMLDSQASYEKLFTALIHTLSKVNMVWGMGNLETSKVISPEVAVIEKFSWP